MFLNYSDNVHCENIMKMIFDMITICIIMPHIRLKNNFTTPSVQPSSLQSPGRCCSNDSTRFCRQFHSSSCSSFSSYCCSLVPTLRGWGQAFLSSPFSSFPSCQVFNLTPSPFILLHSYSKPPVGDWFSLVGAEIVFSSKFFSKIAKTISVV